MPIYEYKALDRDSKELSGLITADSPGEARRRLRAQKLYVVDLHEAKEKVHLHLPRVIRGKSRYELALLTRQFATLMSTGLPVVEALSALIEQTESRALKRTLIDVRQRITEGGSLTEALSAHPRFFDSLYISMVRAGESAGNLDIVLGRLSDYLARQNRVRSRLATALTYPIIVAVIGTIVVIFLLSFVLPKIARVLEEQRKVLPLPTEILIGCSRWLADYWWLVLAIITVVIFLLRGMLSTERGRYLWDAMKLRLPLFGTLLRKQAVSHFSNTLSSLLATGVPVLDALKVVKDVVNNRPLGDSIEEIRRGIMEGTDISTPIKRSKIFPPVLGYMVAVGEESGRLEEMLSRLSEAYEEEIEMTSQRLISVIEPLIIIALGSVVAFIAVSILLPILKASKL